mgnify:CR=1 FL=1
MKITRALSIVDYNVQFALQIGGCNFKEIGLKIRLPITWPHNCEVFFYKVSTKSIV